MSAFHLCPECHVDEARHPALHAPQLQSLLDEMLDGAAETRTECMDD